ncbi:MAG: ABC transporter substrate-binding protein [Betaproteobacteria bacterium]
MDRRTLIRSALGLIGAPYLAYAQAPRPPGKIGFLALDPLSPSNATVSLLRPAWQRLGYVEGETMLLRFAERDAQRLPHLVAELIALKVGVLIVVGGEAVRIVSRVTRVTPIVALDLETDPVRSGLATSFARPGGNVTGLFMDQPSLAGKWIELLREAAPTIERVALLWDPATGRDQLEIGQAGARAKRLETVVIEYSAVTNIDNALRDLGGQQRTGIVVLTSPRFPRGLFAAAAQKQRLPSISFQANQAHAGVLMSYGPNREAYFPRVVVLADKILRGEKPGDIAIEQPAKFELVINLRTAKALGLTIPQSLLLRADEVIQ